MRKTLCEVVLLLVGLFLLTAQGRAAPADGATAICRGQVIGEDDVCLNIVESSDYFGKAKIASIKPTEYLQVAKSLKGDVISYKDNSGLPAKGIRFSSGEPLEQARVSFLKGINASAAPALAEGDVEFEQLHQISAVPLTRIPDNITMVHLHLSDGRLKDIVERPWLPTPDDAELVKITVQEKRCGIKVLGNVKSDLRSKPCSYSVVIFNSKPESVSPDFKLGFEEVLTTDEKRILLITDDLAKAINNEVLTLTINSEDLKIAQSKMQVSPDSNGWHLDFPRTPTHGCRAFAVASPDENTEKSIDIPLLQAPEDVVKDNGISIGPKKVFDVLALRRMLADTIGQLSALPGINGAAITSALSNLQGVSRDTSFLSAQLTTVPTPTVTTNTGNNATIGSANQTNSPGPATSTVSVTLQCPDGSLPIIGSGNTQGCAPVPVSNTNPVQGSTSTQSALTQSNPSTVNQVQSNATSGQQSGTTTTTPSVNGITLIPTAIPSTALSAPTNIGLSSEDILSQQVELNAQIDALKLLLQGALSDQFVVKGERPVATRQQTTLGFSVTLDPPKQYRRAVAEIRVYVAPPIGEENVSVMNLLPSEKTYNVAKITSDEKAFGAGVAISPVAFGLNAGSSHDRLFLAKDTDTIALQFAQVEAQEMSVSFINAIQDAVSNDWFEGRGECRELIDSGIKEFEKPVVFGWQFRPVLGEDYVRAGQRQVFAQLALPIGLNKQYSPRVRILSRWREYDPDSHVVGKVLKRSCSWLTDPSGVALLSQPRIKNVRVADLGQGQVKLTAEGEFFSSGAVVTAGVNTYVPAAFDGTRISIVGRAADFMGADGTRLVAQDGESSDFAIAERRSETSGACGVRGVTLEALPYPDGNSRMSLSVTIGSQYLYSSSRTDKAFPDEMPNFLVLIGNQVYGLRETPFLKQSCDRTETASNVTCQYKFLAPTTDARNAQRFFVRDLAWKDMKAWGTIVFNPALASVSELKDSGVAPSQGSGQIRGAPARSPTPPTQVRQTYLLKGFNFDRLGKVGSSEENCVWPEIGDVAPSVGLCLVVPEGGEFDVLSPNVARLTLPGKAVSPLEVVVQRNGQWDLAHRVVWELAIPKDATDGQVASVVLHRGDSAKATFKGAGLDKVTSVWFEHTKLAVVKAKPADAVTLAGGASSTPSIAVFVTTTVTKSEGHKDLLASATEAEPNLTPDTPPIALLPLEVTR
jgi:hypothetical protein